MTIDSDVSTKRKPRINHEFSLSFIFSLVSALLGFAFSFLAAKYLESERYGQIQYYVSIASIVSIFVTFGADNRIPKTIQFSADKKADVSRYFFLSSMIWVVGLPLYFVISYFALGKLEQNILLIFIVYIVALTSSFSSILCSYFTGISKYELKILLSGLVPHVCYIIIFLCHLLTNTLTLFVDYYLYYTIGIFAISIFPIACSLISKKKLKFTKKEIVSMLIFTAIFVAYNTQNEVSKVIIVEKFDGFKIVGIFSVSNQILSVSSLSSAITTNMSLPVFSKLAKENRIDDLFKYYQAVTRINIYLSVPFFVAFACESHSVLSFFGPSYTGYDLILVILSLGSFFNSIFGPCGSVLAMNGDELKVFWSAIGKFAVYVIVLSMMIFLAPFDVAVYAAAAAAVSSALIANGMKLLFLCKRYHKNFFSKEILFPLIVVVVVCLACFWPLSLIQNRVLWLISNCIVGLVLIVGFIFVSPFKEDKLFFKGDKEAIINSTEKTDQK
jgi:O-antigen/teichoic acid export membrane protein